MVEIFPRIFDVFWRDYSICGIPTLALGEISVGYVNYPVRYNPLNLAEVLGFSLSIYDAVGAHGMIKFFFEPRRGGKRMLRTKIMSTKWGVLS